MSSVLLMQMKTNFYVLKFFKDNTYPYFPFSLLVEVYHQHHSPRNAEVNQRGASKQPKKKKYVGHWLL